METLILVLKKFKIGGEGAREDMKMKWCPSRKYKVKDESIVNHKQYNTM